MHFTDTSIADGWLFVNCCLCAENVENKFGNREFESVRILIIHYLH